MEGLDFRAGKGSNQGSDTIIVVSNPLPLSNNVFFEYFENTL